MNSPKVSFSFLIARKIVSSLFRTSKCPAFFGGRSEGIEADGFEVCKGVMKQRCQGLSA